MCSWTRTVLAFLVSLGVAAFVTGAQPAAPKGGEKPPKADDTPTPPKGEERPAPKIEPMEGNPEDVVAKVDKTPITRADLAMARRQLALSDQRVMPNNEQLVEQLINRVLWQRYFEQEKLYPTTAQIQQTVQNLDAELRQRGANYQRWIAARGLTVEEHVAMISYELAMGRLIERIQKEIPEGEVKAEFDAHPEWYDGSRIHLSQVFIQTSHIGTDAEKLKAAKEKIDKLHGDLGAGKDFERIAKDFSEGAASNQGGDRGWFQRKGADVDEPLMTTAWATKVGEFTKPILGSQGWHILKVLDREPARFTFFGAKPGVMQELTRQRIKKLLDELKGKTRIEKLL